MIEISDDAAKECRTGAGVLFFIFLVLKLTGIIGWSWWWVTAPLWAAAALLLGVNLTISGVRLAIAGVRWARRRNG